MIIRPFSSLGHDGGKTYKLHISPNAPAMNFLSFMVYDPQTRTGTRSRPIWPARAVVRQAVAPRRDREGPIAAARNLTFVHSRCTCASDITRFQARLPLGAACGYRNLPTSALPEHDRQQRVRTRSSDQIFRELIAARSESCQKRRWGWGGNFPIAVSHQGGSPRLCVAVGDDNNLQQLGKRVWEPRALRRMRAVGELAYSSVRPAAQRIPPKRCPKNAGSL